MTTIYDPTSEDVAHIADFEHVFAVFHGGTISDDPSNPGTRSNDGTTLDSLHAPEAYEPSIHATTLDGWELPLSGFTGQYGYSGPWLHESEVIAGGVGEYVLAHPGYWVAIYSSYGCEECGGAGVVWSKADTMEESEEVECPAHCEPGQTTDGGWTMAFKPFEAEAGK